MTLLFTKADRPDPNTRCHCGWCVSHGQEIIVDTDTDKVTHATCAGRRVIEASVDGDGNPVDYQKWLASFDDDFDDEERTGGQ